MRLSWIRDVSVAGKETAPTTGTPHLQIMWTQKNATTWKALKKRLERRGLQSVSFRAVRRTPDKAAAYCKKDGDYQEWGQWPPTGAGARTDVLALRDAVLQGKTKTEILLSDETAATAARFTAYLNELLAATAGQREKERLKQKLQGAILRDWQNRVVLDLDEYAGDIRT